MRECAMRDAAVTCPCIARVHSAGDRPQQHSASHAYLPHSYPFGDHEARRGQAAAAASTNKGEVGGAQDGAAGRAPTGGGIQKRDTQTTNVSKLESASSKAKRRARGYSRRSAADRIECAWMQQRNSHVFRRCESERIGASVAVHLVERRHTRWQTKRQRSRTCSKSCVRTAPW